MKITKKKLKQIILEEIAMVLNEQKVKFEPIPAGAGGKNTSMESWTGAHIRSWIDKAAADLSKGNTHEAVWRLINVVENLIIGTNLENYLVRKGFVRK